MEETTDYKIGDLKDNVANALNRLRSAMNWTQAEFAEKMGVSPAALSNYTNTDNSKIPSLENLVNLCRIPDFKKKGLELSIDTMLSPDFDPESLIKNREGSAADKWREVMHDDYIGVYLCYFFDQTKTIYDQDYRSARELRYGVICIYDDYKGVTGEAMLRVSAVFYKESQEDDAVNLKQALDNVYLPVGEDTKISARNEKIRNVFSKVPGSYTGSIDFSEQHAFISLHSDVINDKALIIMYAPNKRSDKPYIGGVGSVTSVAHGRSHMPTAQKMILSKYHLNCSNEDIAEYLSMYSIPVSMNNESQALSDLCRKLYGTESAATSFLDDGDKKSMISNRMDQLVHNYIDKNICCVCSISEEEDKQIYEFIKRYSI